MGVLRSVSLKETAAERSALRPGALALPTDQSFCQLSVLALRRRVSRFLREVSNTKVRSQK